MGTDPHISVYSLHLLVVKICINIIVGFWSYLMCDIYAAKIKAKNTQTHTHMHNLLSTEQWSSYYEYLWNPCVVDLL